MKSFICCFLAFLFSLTLLAKQNYKIICPVEISSTVTDILSEHAESPNNVLSEELRKELVNRGYSFAQVSITENNGLTSILVKPGIIGDASIAGNNYLSSEGILKKLGWKPGDLFNYNEFYSKSSNLNRNNFIQVDSKLKPIRGQDGEIRVNAAVAVEDKFPLKPYFKLSNDGTEQSSGWRAKAGFELWEAFMPHDRVNISYTTDPKDSSQLSSYFMSYDFGASDFQHTVFAGYSDSKYDNITSSSLNMDIAGEGFYAGYNLTYPLSFIDVESLAFNFGINYIDLSNQIYLGNNSLLASDDDLSLLLPRFGLQGKFSNPFGLQGDNYWSIGIVSDLSTSKNSELVIQNPDLENGFFVPKASLTLFEPVDFMSSKGGLKIRFDGQFSNDPLPTSLKKSLGGLYSIRGYEEREAYGDSGVSLNFEYITSTEQTSFLSLEGNLQKIFFFDSGYVSNVGSMSAANDSVDMQSIGAGLLGNFEGGTDFSFQVGLPLADSFNTQAIDPRTHFSLTIRF